MHGHVERCVTKYCDLANVTTASLKMVTTPNIDDQQLQPEDFVEKVYRAFIASVGKFVNFSLESHSIFSTFKSAFLSMGDDRNENKGYTFAPFAHPGPCPIERYRSS